jgi:hypothetical protein
MQFRDADERLVAVSAALYNRAVGTQFPEGGYSVMYREIPLSPEELASRRTHAMEMMEAGLMDRVEALRLFGSMTHEDAVARLEQIALAKAAEARMLESTPPTGNEGEMEDRSAAAGADVSPAHAEAMADVAEELDAAEAALEALDLDEGSARVVAAVIESLREARGYLGIGPKVEAETELHEEEDMAEEVMAEAAPTEPTEGTPQAAAPEESVAAAATSAGVPASAVAMNGAQVQAAQGIVQAVAKGELPRATGVAMLVQFFNMPEDAADAMMGEVGRSFTITTAAP